MNYVQLDDCREWQFENITEFKGGEMQPYFADCGTGLGDDENSSDNTFMHTFINAKESDVVSYAAELEKSCKKVFENNIEGNLFYQFSAAEGLLYFSYLKSGGTARIILDRCQQENAGDFGYSDYENLCGDTRFAQYSLHYDEMIRGTTCDCGMNYVYRLRDNSLIIIDGGEFEQATDSAISDYMDFLHSLTGTSAGEKMRVSLYICTHAHNDHCDFMSKTIRFHSDEIEVERIAFNFPNPQNTRHSLSVAVFKKRLSEKYPQAEYIRPHAGCRFSIANADIEILCSNEDTIGADSEDIYPGTNDTSMIFCVEADGLKTLFLADCSEDNGAVIIGNYSEKVTDSTFLQAAHHGINEIYDVYERLHAKELLLPQCRMNMDMRFSENYSHMCALYGEENILFAHDATDIFTVKNGEYTSEKRAHVGEAYDGSEW